jgi:transcriptional regulator with XRE-family HTH domain
MLSMEPKKKRALPMLAHNIKKYRSQRGFSQEELAARSGLSSVKMIESGKNNASLQALMSIANVLGVGLDDLVSGYQVSDPTPTALTCFLASPGAADVTPEEVEQLKQLRARGKRPTEDTYYWALKMLRSMSK